MTTSVLPISPKFPHFVPSAAGTSVQKIQDYAGRIAIFGKRMNGVTPVYTLLYSITLSDITGTWPDPLYVNIPSYLNDESLDVFPILAPNTMNDATLLAYVIALAP